MVGDKPTIANENVACKNMLQGTVVNGTLCRVDPLRLVACNLLKGVFSPNPLFFNESARLAPYELTHVRPSPGDCAAGWAQAWRKV